MAPAPAHHTVDSNKNDTKTERNVQTEGKRAVLCNINIMEKERGNPIYLLSRSSITD
jgi:hypothetical protein